ncbi:proteasome subunit beta type-6 isoform X3 [Brachyistius frenatus]|uniref:proteasome subunit beta type-6 isoform X3 n=1 Tax=Brachyistius frenatus TaxID=100188 RepID=UPI0037E9912B
MITLNVGNTEVTCLSVCLSPHLSVSLPACLSVCLPPHLSVCLSPHLSVCLSPHLSVCLSPHLSVCLSPHLSVCLSPHLSVCLSPHLCLSPSPPVCLSPHLSVCLSPHLSVSPPTCLSVCLSPHLSVCLSPHLSVCLSPHLSVCLSPHLSVCLSPHLSVCLPPHLSVSPPTCLSVSLPTCLSLPPPVCLSPSPPVCLSVSPPVCLSLRAYIANRVTDKLTPIHDRIFCCRSGSAADTQAIADVVTYQLGFHSIELDEPPLVETAANLFRASCYRYREELTAGILVAGWDRRKGGQVYCVPIGGMLVRQPVSVGGSGSSYIYGFMDSNYKPGLNKDQCLELTAAALSLAMERDGSSGGVVRLATISEEGVERRVILGNQLTKFSTH